MMRQSPEARNAPDSQINGFLVVQDRDDDDLFHINETDFDELVIGFE